MGTILRADESRAVHIVGDSPAMQRTIGQAEHLASKDVNVLLRGETGTGKGLFAAFLHARSRRARGPLVRFDCTGVPADRAETQLFGGGKAAAATSADRGLFARARGGTLVLDAVGELPLAVQTRLLHALEGRDEETSRASHGDVPDVRVLACTCGDLTAEVRGGLFRRALLDRLAVTELFLPALRDRTGDIPLLVRELARKYSERFGLAYVVQFGPDLVEAFVRLPWPGNVRQLENVIARCVAMATGPIVGPQALSMVDGATLDPPALEQAISLREQVEAFERSILSSALAATGGNQSEVSRRLRVTRASLYDRMKKYGLSSARRS